MLLSLLGTWLTSPLIPFEVAPQVCSHSISALSSCEARSNILYYHGKAAHTKWWSHNEKIQCPISTAKYLTSKLNWQMKLSAWWGAGKGLQSQGTEPQCLLLYSTLQFTEPRRCIWSLTFHAWRRHRHPHFTARELRLKRLVQILCGLTPGSGGLSCTCHSGLQSMRAPFSPSSPTPSLNFQCSIEKWKQKVWFQFHIKRNLLSRLLSLPFNENVSNPH